MFVRILRRLGVPVATAHAADFIRGVEAVGSRNREDVRLCGRCTLVSNRRDAALYDLAFDMFWRIGPDQVGSAREGSSQLLASLSRPAGSRPQEDRALTGEGESNGPAQLFQAGRNPGRDNPHDRALSHIAIYSPVEAIKDKDFALFSEAELADARAFLQSIDWTVARHRTRRRKPAEGAHEIDMRRLLRRSLRHGGEVLDLPRRGLRTKRRRLVVLCDISGSMDRYARMLLQSLHAIESSFGGAEVFVFGTRLTRVTHSIRRKDADEAIRAVAAEVHDWAGGTRIGAAIANFNRTWSRRVAAHGAIVLIISDGWDRGEPEQLRAEIARLQRSSHRLIWLNPLLGSPVYRPATRGMQAALPYVDDFLPAHNLSSLQSLALLLNTLPEQRPLRRRERPSGGL